MRNRVLEINLSVEIPERSFENRNFFQPSVALGCFNREAAVDCEGTYDLL
jgi:hypothetical protein